jgi:AAA domain
LKSVLPTAARVGTVEKFPGQEAAVIVLSMATSSMDETPRNIEFMFSKNRLNVAISRARCLTVVVASRRLLEVPCSTIEQIRLVNTFCWAKRYSDNLSLLKNQLMAIGRRQRRVDSPTSRRATFVTMVETAHLREGDDIACGRKLYATRPWAVLVEREMRSGVMMILKIARQYAAQVTLVKDDNVIQTFTADRTDETLDVGVLPG